MSDRRVQILMEMGLTEVMARTYLAMGNRAMSVLELSRETGVARTSIYADVERLVEMGLAERTIEYKRSKYKRAKEGMLGVLVEKEKERIKKVEADLGWLLEELKTGEQIEKTEVRYFAGREGFQQMMWNALAAEKETVGWSEFGRVEVVGEKFYEGWVNEFREKGLRDRVLANPTKRVIDILRERLDSEGHQLRTGDVRLVAEGEMRISGDTTIYNNVFAVCWWRGTEVVGVEIENGKLVETQRSIFETLWNQAKEV